MASEKNFPNRKNYVCIWGKMGYNRTEVYPSRQTHSRRYILLKILVVVLLTFSMVALAALTWVKLTVQSQTEAIAAEAAAVAGQNRVLEQRVENMDSDDTVRAIAQEELGLIDPDTVLIDIKK